MCVFKEALFFKYRSDMLVLVSFCLDEQHDGSLSHLTAHNFCTFFYFCLFWNVWTWRWLTPNATFRSSPCSLVGLTLEPGKPINSKPVVFLLISAHQLNVVFFLMSHQTHISLRPKLIERRNVPSWCKLVVPLPSPAHPLSFSPNLLFFLS